MRRSLSVLLVSTLILGPVGIDASAVTGYRISTNGQNANIRTCPSLGCNAFTSLANGTPVDIICQTYGDVVAGSNIWNHIGSPVNGYVSDVLVNTPVFNGFSPGIPRCDANGNPIGSEPPPPPGSSNFVMQGPILESCDRRGTFEMGLCYRLKFTITNNGSASGTATLGVTESGNYSYGDRGGLRGSLFSEEKSFNLSPGQSVSTSFIAWHKWDWVDPGKGAAARIWNAISVADTLTTCSPKLKSLSGFSKFKQLERYIRYGQAAVDVGRVVDEIAGWVGPLVRSRKTFNYVSTPGTSPGLRFGTVPVSLGIPKYKARLFLDGQLHQIFAAAAACVGWTAIRTKVAASPVGGVFTGAAFIASGSYLYTSNLLHKAAQDPDPDIYSLPPRQEHDLSVVNELSEGPVKDYLSALVDMGELVEAQTEADIRYAAAIEGEHYDAAALQANAADTWGRQAESLLEGAALNFQTWIDVADEVVTEEQDAESLEEQLSNDGLPPQMARTLTELGFSDEEQLEIRDAWTIPVGENWESAKLEEELANLNAFVLRSFREGGFDNRERLQEAKTSAGLPVVLASVAGNRGAGGWYLNDVIVTLTSADYGAATSRIEYSTDLGQTWSNYTSPIVFEGEGSRVLLARAVGLNGLVEDPPLALPVNIDMFAPVTFDDLNEAWRNAPFVISLNGLDSSSGPSGLYYSLGDTEPSLLGRQGSQVWVDKEGIFDLRYFSVDAAGNQEIVRRSMHKVKLDMTPPSSSIVRPELPLQAFTVALRGPMYDSLSGIARVEIEFTNVYMGTTIRRNASLDVDSETWALVTALPAGVYDARSIAKDSAGNLQTVFEDSTRLIVVGAP